MEPDEQLFRIGIELAEVLIFKLKGAQFSERHDYRRVSLYFFSRSYKCYQALRLLWREGFTEDAYALARTIYELRLQAIYVSHGA